MEIKTHIENGWNSTLRYIGPSLLLTFVLTIVSILSLGILAPVATAGYFQSLLMAQRDGRTPEVRDLFGQMSLFLPLLLLGFIAFVLVMLGFLLLVFPGLVLVVIMIFAFLYLLPLMTDEKLGLFDAVKKSWDMAVASPMGDHVVITIIYIALLSLGGSLPFAILFTQPLATFILLSFYEDRFEG